MATADRNATSQGPASLSPAPGRRRPPSPTEQQRRETWGRQTGQLVKTLYDQQKAS